MNIGILTYHFSDNYGALMQAYALRQWFLSRGLKAEFINYHPAYVEGGGRLDRPWKPSLWRKNATILYMKLAQLQRQVLGDSTQRRAFQSFRSEALGVSGPRLHQASELIAEVQRYQMLVCGSDQIWNPSIQRGLDPVYFLKFPGSESVRRVAYAPSFGRDEIEFEHYSELYRLLKGLDAISIREASGIEIIRAIGMPETAVQVVPDPTILLGVFDQLVDTKCAIDDSVFCYALRTDEVIREVATETARLTGSALRSPRSPHQRWRDIGEGVTPGPVEWLQSLAQAQMVVSNSFHGVALSVVLNRPFIAVSLPGKRAKMNARVHNLLTITGLTDRIVDFADPARVRTLVDTPIDWAAANVRLATERAKAEAYLDAQIEKAQQSLVPQHRVGE